MTWPAVDAPATAPTDHGDVRTQAYLAGGGDYFRSGYYSSGLPSVSAVVNAVALTLNRLYVRPFFLPVRRAFDRIGCNVTSASTAASGGVLRMGIYNPGAGAPGSLLVDAGTISSESTGAKEITISQTLDPGVYWLGLVAQVASAPSVSFHGTFFMPWHSYGTAPASAAVGHPYMAGVTGALGSFTESGTIANGWSTLSLRAT